MKYIWLFPAIIVGWGVYWALVVNTSDSWQVSGQFGDLFGAFTALVTGLAFAGIIIAILLQRQDLELQREELRLQRQELARSAEAQELQNKALIITAELNARSALLAYYSDAVPGLIGGQPHVRDNERAVAQATAMNEIIFTLGIRHGRAAG